MLIAYLVLGGIVVLGIAASAVLRHQYHRTHGGAR